MRCPFANWRPVANHSGPMTGHLGFVVHVQVGTGSCYGEFNTAGSQASSHFWVAQDGTLEQYVDTDFIAWAEMAGNGEYVSCETEGTPDTEMTGAQVAALGRLLAWLHAEYSIPLQTCDHGGQGMTTHAHYPSGTADPDWGNHACPGPLRSAQLPAILAAAQHIDLQNNPPAPEEDDMAIAEIWHDNTRQVLVWASGKKTPLTDIAEGSALETNPPLVYRQVPPELIDAIPAD